MSINEKVRKIYDIEMMVLNRTGIKSNMIKRIEKFNKGL